MLSLALLCARQDPAPTAAELAAHVQLLASDVLAGRDAGTPQADQAAAYLAGALAAAGLQPAGENGSWYQWFEIELEPRPGPCTLELPNGRSVRELGTLACSASGRARAVLVDCGYGVDEYASRDVRGKIVLVRRYTAAGPNASGEAARGGDLRAKVRAAASAGAAAIILGTDPQDLGRGGSGHIPFEAAPGSMPIPVLTVLPKDVGALAALAGSGAHEVGLSVQVERPRARTSNVLGLLPGASPEILVLGAHYDHLGHGGGDSLAPGVHEIHNGADDNASGTALLLELAEALAAGPPPPRSLLFALWGAEEDGLLGSEHWCRQPTVPWLQVVANLNFDMVGRLQNGKITVGSAETAAAFAPALQRVPPAAGLEYSLASGPLPGGGGSDHMAFHRAQVAAVFFFSGMHADYHKPSDDWEKLDYPRLQLLAEAMARLVVDLGAQPRADFAFQAPPPPDPHAGQSLASTGERASMGTIPDYGAAPAGGGMQLAGVSPGGAAEKAGLRAGDVIKKVGDAEVADIYDFMDALGRYRAGERVEVAIVRAGLALTVPVILGGRREVQ